MFPGAQKICQCVLIYVENVFIISTLGILQETWRNLYTVSQEHDSYKSCVYTNSGSCRWELILIANAY